MEQGSDEWFEKRLGKVTGSNFGTAIAKPGSTRTLYMQRLIAEILTGTPQGTYKNAIMERGTEFEPSACDYYEQINGILVKHVGFIETSENTGVSPDGLVGNAGGLEVKCPLPSTHIKYILADREVAVYRPQVQGCMAATGRKWWDFVSYCPEVISRPYWCFRVVWDQEYIDDLNLKLDKFITEMKTKLSIIKRPKF